MSDGVVQVEQGQLRGFRDGRVLGWLGIPYAAPPVGALRFRPPAPPAAWSGVREAVHFGPACVQPAPILSGGRTALGGRFSEDCLYLNIWSPSTAGRRPVMVWVHGGAFIGGSGALYRGGPLSALGDIVVVTINYRLGPFGFINFGDALGDGEIESNLGLRDMIAALRWVKANIAGFGGDPDQVTLAGESAGSIAATLLVAAETARPLFHRVILQSGTATLAQSRTKSLRVAEAYLEHLGLTNARLPDLQALSTARLFGTEKKIAGGSSATLPAAPWLDGTLLPDSIKTLQRTPVTPLSLLAGSNRDEIRLFKVLPLPRVLPTRRSDITRLLERDLDPALASRVNDAYPDTPAGTNALATDLSFGMPMLHQAERNAAAGAPTWLYRFDYAHPLLGACHALELFFLFPFPGLLPAGLRGGFLTGLRSGLSERIRSAWTSFVRTGSPGEDWPAFTLPHRQTRLFALQDTMVPDPIRDRREAWNGHDAFVGR